MTNVSGGGQTFTWRDGQSGDWTNSANWTTQIGAPGVPGALDTAVLDGSQSYTVTISKTDQATANALSWTNAQASLVVSGALTLNDGPQSNAGTMVIQGGSLNLALPSSGGTASLNDETIDLSDGAISAQVASSTAGGTANLTLGATLVQVAGTSNSVNLSVGGSPVVSNSLTNAGIIQAGVAGALDGADQDLQALLSLGVTLLRGAFTEAARLHAGQFDLIYLHRVATATRCLKPVRQYFDAHVVYSVADLHHLRIKAQSLLDHARSAELIEQAQNLALQEITAALAADCVVTHSVSEAEQLRQIPSLAAADKVRVIPWALSAAPVRLPFGKRAGVAFIGGFAHVPNVDAARWLVHEIMPLVWREAPEVECLIAGSDLSDDLRQELAQPGVTVLGRVDQLDDVFWRVRLTVAPLRFGAGLKDKVLRSMTVGLPCVGTPEAFSGMPGLPATINNSCEAQTASDLAAAIVKMHRDPVANARCAAAGLDYVAEFYSRARIDALIREMAQPALDHYWARTGRRSDCAVLQFGAPPLATAAITSRQVVFC